MFGSFQASQPPPEELPKTPRTKDATKHPGGTAFACLECRRRKSRCDGLKPCTRCRDGQKEHLCQYVQPKPRIIPSQKALNQLAESLQQCKGILEKLLPSADYTTLQDLSRKELIELVAKSDSPAIAELRTASLSDKSTNMGLPADGSLALEQLNTHTSEYDEQTTDFVADDVNALSLSASRHSSYVGSSSISAALKVMAVLCPDIMKHSSLTAPNSPFNKSERSSIAHMHVTREVESSYIDAYFGHVHPIVPMIHEARFRQRFEAREAEHDPAWGVLLNMVLAMGAIAGETCPESIHAVFYQRAKSMLSFDLFGSGKLEVVQALALMGGLYLHYCNRPNMAVATTGAALRMAYALGLHRKSPSQLLQGELLPPIPNGELEIKRRTWWSLVCVDTWGSTTLGRPSMGDIFGPAISVSRMSFDDFKDYPLEEQAPALTASTMFCQISAQLQDKLASKPILGLAEAALIDAQLQEQYNNLPPLLRSPNRCPTNLLVPRAILKWQHQNARLLLHRPILLAAALSHKLPAELSAPEQDAINACRALAADSIVDIACDWQPDPICGWHAVWYLFQASMVPLVSLFYEYRNAAECGKWHGQIEMVIRLLQSMELWSPVAKRTKDVITELHESAVLMQSEESAPRMDRMNMQHLYNQQTPFGYDDAWANNTWLNFADWPNFPMEGADFGQSSMFSG